MFVDSNRLKHLLDHFIIVNYCCPSHYWPYSEPTLIDYIFTQNMTKIRGFYHYNLIPATHHDILIVSYKTKFNNKNKPTRFSLRDYNKISHHDLSLSLQSIEWIEIYETQDINIKVNIFNEQFSKLFIEHVPVTQVKLKTSSKPWFTLELNQMLRERKIKYLKYKSCSDGNLREIIILTIENAVQRSKIISKG